MPHIEPNLFIKYKGIKPNNDSDIDLALLGESIIGFNKTIKEIIKISKINGEISVNAVSVKNGSVIFGLDVNSILNTVPFDNYQDYLNFISIASHHTYDHIVSLHSGINDYVAKNPADFFVEGGMLSAFYVRMMKWAQKQKNVVTVNDEEKNVLPKDYAVKLYKLTRNKAYNKALKPFVENEVKEIELSEDGEFKKSIKINNANFENYLSDDEQILPQLKNGEIFRLTGSIVSLQSSKGEYMKFKAQDLDRKYQLLILYPQDNKKTDDYLEFYKKIIRMDVEVIRHSLYQRPKLKIINVEFVQSSML